MRIIHVIATLVLIFLPWPAAMILSKFSPYFNAVDWRTYSLIWFGCLVVFVIAGWLMAIRTLPRLLLYGGAMLFLIGAVMTSVMGLSAPPDFSPAMLQFPEREHFRYSFLFIAAILFAAGVILILRYNWPIRAGWNRWILLLLIPSLAEIFWEFTHQYLTYHNMKAWVDGGRNPADFVAHYFNRSVFNFGAFGRLCQYLLIAWLAYILVQGRYMRKWAFGILLFFCAFGVTSSVVLLVSSLPLPKNLEFLFLFFIPASPFFLLYWEGVALLTTKPGAGDTEVPGYRVNVV